MIADGHIHTPFCPHGTKDQLEEYVNWFIERKAEEITFTEHAPLPDGFIDTTPTKDSGMEKGLLPEYLDKIRELKNRYKKHIRINIGLEIDYIEGYEEQTTAFLDEIGPYLDDSILSVHFLKQQDNYYCLDYSDDYFKIIVQKFGSVANVHEAYYRTMSKAIQFDLGVYKPKRIGHITLIRKFQLKYPSPIPFDRQVGEILKLMKNHGLALDYNGAGTAKPYCLEPYPDHSIVEKAIDLGIPFVYGSDAHQVKDLGQGFTELHPNAVLSKPSALLIKP